MGVSVATVVGLSPSQLSWDTAGGISGAELLSLPLVAWARRRASASRLSSCGGSPSRSNSRVNCRSGKDWSGPLTARFMRFRRPCMSEICPDRNASVVSMLASSTWLTFLSAARKVDSRASWSGTAQGSARWSAPPERPSSRRMRRDQSSAPTKIQVDWTRPRSAVSTSTARHCCHMAAAAKVATSVTVSMASSSAAPRDR